MREREREREGERRGSTQKYGNEKGGGEGKRESGQDHTGVKGRNVKELDGENQRSSQEYGGGSDNRVQRVISRNEAISGGRGSHAICSGLSETDRVDIQE